MKKKNMAVLLSGLNDSLLTISDYQKYFENIKSKIYNYFGNRYNIDIFICMNELNSVVNLILIKNFLPIQFCIESNNEKKKNKLFELLINYKNINNIYYDLILVTRFDITIFSKLKNINFNKLNIINVLNSKLEITKDLLIFPDKYLINILTIIKNNIDFIPKLENEEYFVGKKKIAILFSGPHLTDNLDFNKYTENIKNKMIIYFNNIFDIDVDIDTFICTNKSKVFTGLLNLYSPITFCIEDDDKLRKSKVLNLLNNYIINNNKSYDMILLTSFDITIINELTDIDLNKLNIVTVLNSKFQLTKDLFVFPTKYLNNLIDIVQNNNFIGELEKESYVNIIDINFTKVLDNCEKKVLNIIRTAILFHVGNITIFTKILENYTNFFKRDILIFITIHNTEYINIIKENLPNAIITVIENKGLDIGGNLNNMKLLFNHPNYENIENIYFFHTKSNDLWREELYLPLTNNYEQIETLIQEYKNTPIIIGSNKFCFRNKSLNRIYIKDIIDRNKELKKQLINDWRSYLDEYILEDNNLKDEKNIFINLKVNSDFYRSYENGMQILSSDNALNHFIKYGKNECYRISNPCYIKKFAKESYFIAGTIFLCNKEYFKIFKKINFDYEYSILETGYVLNYIPRKAHAWEYLYGLLAYSRNGYIISVDKNGKTDKMIHKDNEFDFEIFKNCNLDLSNKNYFDLLEYFIYNGIKENRIYSKSQIYKIQAIINKDLLSANLAIFMVIPSDNNSNECISLLNYIKILNDNNNSIDIYVGYDFTSVNCIYGLSIISEPLENIYKVIDNYNILNMKEYNFYLGYNVQKNYDTIIANTIKIRDAVYYNETFCKNITIN